MNPVIIEGHNKVLGKPFSMTDEECTSLHVFCDGESCISEWELSDEELEAVVKTRRIRLRVLSGETQPPVALWPVRPEARAVAS